MCYVSTNCGAFKEGASLGKPSSAVRHCNCYRRNRRPDGVDGVEVVRLRSEHALLNVLAVGNYELRPVTGIYIHSILEAGTNIPHFTFIIIFIYSRKFCLYS